MSGIYIHSTNALMPILESGIFLGSSKSSAKLGPDAPKQNPTTLFIEWMVGRVEESVTRFRLDRGGTRGILVFKDPKNQLDKSRKYPALKGENLKLSQLSLRAVIASQEDLGLTGDGDEVEFYVKAVTPMIKAYKGNPFGFYARPFNDAVFANSINAVLREALAHGCFT
ncbi:hypothetical protein [Dyella choica]|uniref:Uncharacterized protein n=1 Tax=Dyella choica TaxID=1927959 RepID=A0A432M5X0_9GAMM|nr:hypothetical protein [Dyella choica]RUL75281.1 hypothetical protein EKH80_11155 [Dyella choica]